DTISFFAWFSSGLAVTTIRFVPFPLLPFARQREVTWTSREGKARHPPAHGRKPARESTAVPDWPRPRPARFPQESAVFPRPAPVRSAGAGPGARDEAPRPLPGRPRPLACAAARRTSI